MKLPPRKVRKLFSVLANEKKSVAERIEYVVERYPQIKDQFYQADVDNLVVDMFDLAQFCKWHDPASYLACAKFLSLLGEDGKGYVIAMEKQVGLAIKDNPELRTWLLPEMMKIIPARSYEERMRRIKLQQDQKLPLSLEDQVECETLVSEAVLKKSITGCHIVLLGTVRFLEVYKFTSLDSLTMLYTSLEELSSWAKTLDAEPAWAKGCEALASQVKDYIYLLKEEHLYE